MSQRLEYRFSVADAETSIAEIAVFKRRAALAIRMKP